MDINSNSFLPFEIPSQEDWKLAAQQELQGTTPDSLIVKKGMLEVQPIYFSAGEKSFENYALKPSSNIYGGPRYWANMPRIEVNDDSKANITALEYLNSGADGVLFDIKANKIQFEKLLKDIHLNISPVSLVLEGTSHEVATELARYLRNSKPINGAIFWKNQPSEIKAISEAYADLNLHPFGIIAEPHSDTESEIANALSKAITLIDRATDQGIKPQDILNQICFSINIGPDFFNEIAKLKALRNLWLQVNGAYQVTSQVPLYIHATSLAWINEKYQPHGNMIKTTTAAMSAVLGGCDGLTIEPEDASNAMMSRIARNVSSIIREESHFSKVADATDGSYYLNTLTEQLAEKAWQKFQSMHA